jgi:carbamate kinase
MALVVIAVGGNALQHKGARTIKDQLAAADVTCRAVAEIVARGWQVVLTHGNGPQVGDLLQQLETAGRSERWMPLDVVDANTQGGIGYMLQQVLGNHLRRLGVPKPVVAMVTQVRVDSSDPAFGDPQKPIGSFFSAAEAARLGNELGWTMKEDAGRGYRRVVPSPKPLQIIELDAIRAMLASDVVPIAVGGGGVPVVETGPGRLSGVPAVIDKDHASALLASLLGAEMLLISTAVPQIQLGYGTPQARAIERLSVDDARAALQRGEFPAGSMGPKIEAALQFVRSGPGRRSIVTDPAHLLAALDGQGGTTIG